MSVWAWAAVGLVVWIVLAAVFGIVVGRMCQDQEALAFEWYERKRKRAS